MQIIGFFQQSKRILAALLLLLVFVGKMESQDLELSRTARPWEFLCAVGTRAGLFGNESGNFEAWVYPLKLFRNFHLRFLVDGRMVPAEALARTVTVRPETSTILYAGDTFSIQETLFVPVKEPGAVITFEVETAHPLEIEAVFERDFQLEWPAALGATYLNWEAGLPAFSFGEEQKKYVAIVGSPTADITEQEYQTNYSSSQESAFRLGVMVNFPVPQRQRAPQVDMDVGPDTPISDPTRRQEEQTIHVRQKPRDFRPSVLATSRYAVGRTYSAN